MSLDPERLQGLAGFRRALRRFLAASETISRAHGVTPQQYQALLAIEAWPDRTPAIKSLAQELLLTHHAAVQLVDRLAAAGLVERRDAPSDRRSVLIALTPAGEAAISDLAEQHLMELLRQEPLLAKSLRLVRKAGDGEPGAPRLAGSAHRRGGATPKGPATGA